MKGIVVLFKDAGQYSGPSYFRWFRWKFYMNKKKMYHQQNLQIHGVFVPGIESFTGKSEIRHFRLLRLHFYDPSDNVQPVPLKIPIVGSEMTPYALKKGKLFYENQELNFENVTVKQDTLPPEEDEWHYKGYTLPFEGTKNKYLELRLNLRLSGFCPGKCFFCHRWHSYRIKPLKTHKPIASKTIERLCHDEGGNIFKKINRIILISELFGNQQKNMDQLEKIKTEILERGYPIDSEFGSCSTEIRSPKYLSRLYKLVIPKRYSFSLEFFRNREQLMGKYKGVSIDELYGILEGARNAGFDEIQLNYLAGIDSLEICRQGFEKLVARNLIDSVGLSTFTAFNEKQIEYRAKEAWDPTYYKEMVDLFNALNLKIYHPESYDMVTPYGRLMERT